MANIEFNNVMWSSRDNLDSQKLSQVQQNSDNIYNARINNPRGILGKIIRTTSTSSISSTTPTTIETINFNVEEKRAIGFGFSAPYIFQDNTTNATTLVDNAMPTFGVRLDGITTIDAPATGISANGIDGSFAQAESARTVNLWQDRYTGGGTSVTNFDGFAINMYYINTALTAGNHDVIFWVRNSATTGSPAVPVGAFTIKANSAFPMVMWVEDLGAVRSYG